MLQERGRSAASFARWSALSTASSVPTPALTLDAVSGTAPLPLTATLAATDSDSPNLTYGLVWGDGTTAAAGSLQTTSSSPVSISHTYAAAGTFTATLTVSDGTHAAQDSQVVTVSAPERGRAVVGSVTKQPRHTRSRTAATALPYRWRARS